MIMDKAALHSVPDSNVHFYYFIEQTATLTHDNHNLCFLFNPSHILQPLELAMQRHTLPRKQVPVANSVGSSSLVLVHG